MNCCINFNIFDNYQLIFTNCNGAFKIASVAARTTQAYEEPFHSRAARPGPAKRKPDITGCCRCSQGMARSEEVFQHVPGIFAKMFARVFLDKFVHLLKRHPAEVDVREIQSADDIPDMRIDRK